MAIKQVEIQDFLVFKGEFTADFCPGVNVLIGGNGTGKTTLMKVMYAVCENSNPILGKADAPMSDRAMWKYRTGSSALAHYFTANLDMNHWERFYNICNTLKKCQIIYNGIRFGWHDMSSETEIDLRQKGKLGENDHIQMLPVYEIRAKDSPGACLKFDDKTSEPFIKSVYIPTTDMLSHSRNLLEFKYKYPDLPFDKTLIDIIANAKQPSIIGYPVREENVFTKIEKIVGGEVILENDIFYVKKKDKDGQMIEMSLEASGYRKFGLLYKLLRNGLLRNGNILFWDEPENSLNPELVPVLVNILLELSRNDIQVFIATHDYNLARYFDIRRDKNIPVMFHNLSKTDNGQIICHSSSDYIKLPDNLLETASADLFKAVINDAKPDEE